MSTTKIATLGLTALITLSIAPSADAGFRDWFRRHMPRPTPRYVPAPVVHHHAYRVVQQQVWVPPVTQRVFVGYSRFGFPQYQDQIVQQGYYRTVRYHVCSCGHRTG